jgi:hypothetical protein
MDLRIAIVVLTAALAAFQAHSAEDVQRLQIDRDRQQMDLRLKMQQQQERARLPSLDALTEQRRGALEREQVQRQQQLFNEDARALALPQPMDDAESAARREIQRQRSDREALEQAQRFEAERARQ